MSETQTITIPDIRDVFKQLDRVRSELENHAPQLVKTIDVLEWKASEPDEQASDIFRTRVGQALQDAERIVGPVLPRDHALRPEMDMRGVSVPGLDEPSVARLLNQTPDLASQPMVDRIRGLAHDAVSLGRDQRDNPEIEHAVSFIVRDLEHSPRLSQAAASQSSPKEQAASTADHDVLSPTSDHAATHSGETPQETVPHNDPDHDTRLHASPGGGTPPQAPGDDKVVAPQSSPERPHVTPTQAERAEPAASTDSHTQTTEREGSPSTSTAQAKGPSETPDPTSEDKKKPPVVTVRGPGVFARILDAVRPTTITPEQKVMTPGWAQKVNEQTERHVQKADNETVARAEQWGARATRALDALQQAPASTVMAEIANAAQNDPGGMEGVLGGMKPDGRYEALHGKFREEKASNQAFAAQIREAGEAVAAYDDHRAKVEDIGVRRGNGAELAQKFRNLDAEVGEKAGKVPGKEPGSSLLEDMSEKIREVVKKAITVVANIIRPAPSASASPSP